MQIDALVLLLVCVAVSEAILAGSLSLAGVRALRRDAGSVADVGANEGANDRADEATSRLGVLSTRLLVGGVAALVLLWLALLAAVGTTPGVMCVRGVLAEEARSIGIGPYLPWILGAAVAARLGGGLAAGMAAVLRSVERRAHAAALARTSLRWMTGAGIAGAVGAAATLVYVAAPRVAPPSAGGCCLAVMGAGDAFGAAAGRVASAMERSVATGAFFLAGLVAFVAAAVVARRLRRDAAGPTALPLGTLAAAAVASVVSGAAFFATALAPARLGLPFHECAACLLQAAPELWIGVALLLAGSACAIWTVLAAWTARRHGLVEESAPATGRLLGFARFAYASSLAMALTATVAA